MNWCPCGKVEGHRDRCLSIRTDNLTHRIGKYSGFSRNSEFTGFQKVGRQKTSSEARELI